MKAMSKSDVKVRKLRHWKHADFGPLRVMDARCFPHDTSFWNDEWCHWWVASVENYKMVNSRTDVAYAGIKIDGRGVAHIMRCGVLPEFRGRGLQRLVIASCVRWCYGKGVNVIKTYTSHDNARSIHTFKRCGFRSRRTRDGEWIGFTLRLEGA